MTKSKENGGGRRRSGWRIAAWATAALLLLTPLVAMQFTNEVNWDGTDFAVFGALLIGAGLTYELASRKTGNTAYRLAIGIALLAAFLLIWINGAVGIIGNEDNAANLMFFGVLAIGLTGAIIARFEPKGMVRAMYVTGSAQALTFFIAWIAGWGFTGPITIIFVAMWLISARLFGQAATQATEQESQDDPGEAG